MRLLLPIITLILFVTFPQRLDARNGGIYMSEALQTVMRQAEQTYLAPTGGRIEGVGPNAVASVLGLTMQGQKKYIKQNRNYLPHFNALKKEILSFLNKLAKYYNNRSPKDGKYIDGKSLSKQFYKYLNGSMNEWVTRNKHINPAQVWQPLILNQVTIAQRHTSPPDQIPDSTGIFTEKEDDPGGIVLLGQEAPLVEHDITADGMKSVLSTLKNFGNEKNKNIKKTPIRKGVILGNWQKVDNYMDSCRATNQIKRMPYYTNFRRESGKVLYVGSFETKVYSVEKYNYLILSEKQIDPYTIEYKSMLTSKDLRRSFTYHKREFTTTVFRDDKNRLILCRGSISPMQPATYIK